MPNEVSIQHGAPLPPGYAFLPKGNIFKTARTRRLTHAAGSTLYIVTDPLTARTAKPRPLGLAAPAHILQQVLSAEISTRASRAAAVARRDDLAASEFRTALEDEFPHMPTSERDDLVRHALVKRSGRVGRTGTLEMRRKVRLAVEARIRHRCTGYEGLLRRGEGREAARRAVWERVREVSALWRGDVVEKAGLGDEKSTTTSSVVKRSISGTGVARSKAQPPSRKKTTTTTVSEPTKPRPKARSHDEIINAPQRKKITPKLPGWPLAVTLSTKARTPQNIIAAPIKRVMSAKLSPAMVVRQKARKVLNTTAVSPRAPRLKQRKMALDSKVQ